MIQSAFQENSRGFKTNLPQLLKGFIFLQDLQIDITYFLKPKETFRWGRLFLVLITYNDLNNFFVSFSQNSGLLKNIPF